MVFLEFLLSFVVFQGDGLLKLQEDQLSIKRVSASCLWMLCHCRYMEESGHYAPNNGRSSHNVGRLGNLIRDNDEFFELISSKFISERRYSVSVKAAAARLLFSCSITWMYPHVFEDPMLENLKSWTTDDTTRLSGDDHYWKHESGDRRSSDSEMLKTYSTGLLAGNGVDQI